MVYRPQPPKLSIDTGEGGHRITYKYLNICIHSNIQIFDFIKCTVCRHRGKRAYFSDTKPNSLTLYDTDAGKPKLTYPKVRAEGEWADTGKGSISPKPNQIL